MEQSTSNCVDLFNIFCIGFGDHRTKEWFYTHIIHHHHHPHWLYVGFQNWFLREREKKTFLFSTIKFQNVDDKMQKYMFSWWWWRWRRKRNILSLQLNEIQGHFECIIINFHNHDRTCIATCSALIYTYIMCFYRLMKV